MTIPLDGFRHPGQRPNAQRWLHHAERAKRKGWLFATLGLGSCIFWASYAPLDYGVPLNGQLVSAAHRQEVQSGHAGSIERILVVDGGHVKSGQALVELNRAQAHSDTVTLQSQYWAALLTNARLVAERDNASDMLVDDYLATMARQDRNVESATSLQRQLFYSRRMQRESEINALRQAIHGHEREMAGLRLAIASHQRQRQLLSTQLKELRPLAEEGYVAKSRFLEIQHAHENQVGVLAESNGQLGRLQAQSDELRHRITEVNEKFQSDVRTQLADNAVALESLQAKLKAAEHQSALTTVRAPVTGRVVDLRVFTAGGIVEPGQLLMQIVPDDNDYVVEAELPVSLVDRVHPGMPAHLSFSAFNRAQTPRLHGKISVVGADRLLHERNQAPYYPIKLAIPNVEIERLKELKLRPGMPVDVFVIAGERTMLSYLLKPLQDRLRSALTE